MTLTPDYIKAIDDETGRELELDIARYIPASDEAREIMAQAEVGADEGRSEWMLIRLQNGDLIFGCFPRGDTYFALEVEASF